MLIAIRWWGNKVAKTFSLAAGGQSGIERALVQPSRQALLFLLLSSCMALRECVCVCL